jgi:outer membrane protein TolC
LVTSYTRYNRPRTLIPMTPAVLAGGAAAVPTTEDLFSSGVLYELPLFTGFAQRRAVEIAAVQRRMARVALALSREQLIYNVRAIYLKILSLQAQARAQGEYVEALVRLREDIARQVRLGRKARVDLLKAAAEVEKARARRTQLQGQADTLRAALAALLKVKRVGELEEVPVRPRAVELDEAEIAAVLARSRRVRAATLEEEQRRLQVEKEQGAYYPQVALSLYYGQNYGPNDDSNPHSGRWENQEVWQAGVQLQWRLWDFGAVRAKVERARLQARQSRYRRQKVEQELRRDLIEAVVQVNTAVAAFRQARAELEVSREVEKIEQSRFEQGAADIYDLLQAKARRQLALSRLLEARYGYQVARYYLDYLREKGVSR